MDLHATPAIGETAGLLDHLPMPVAPLVSVIVTNHNYARHLPACLASILNQSYPRIECIVVDEASTDGSGEMLDDIERAGDFAGEGRTLQVIKNARALGQIGASAAALKHSSGQYIIFFDADDYMFVHAVEAHVTAFQCSRIPVGVSSFDLSFLRDDELIISGQGGFYQYVKSKAGQGALFCRRMPVTFATARPGFAALNLHVDELHYVPHNVTGWVWGNTSSLCFRRDAVIPMFARVPDLNGSLDDYLLGGIHPFTGSILIDRPLAAYRIHGDNCWALMPPMSNFIHCDPIKQTGRRDAVVAEILQTFLFNAEYYARHLTDDDLFLAAVASLYRPEWTDKSAVHGFSRAEFLRVHQDRLKSAFGEARYAHWAARHSLAGRLLDGARRRGLLRLPAALARRVIGNSGVERIWRRYYG